MKETILLAGLHMSDKGYEESTHEKQAEFARNRCWCHTCRPITIEDMRMILCPECGNKRCPKATNHTNACTNSNDPGQEGSIYYIREWI
jgi:Zn finger protein HypA/HybF involved in hydrogenase expression